MDDDEREVNAVIEQTGEATENGKIAKFREIVRTHSMLKIDGTPVDALSANVVITVYDALSPESRERFVAMPVDRMVHIAWKLSK